MSNDKRTGYEEAAKAIAERAAGHRQNGDHELYEECLQCASMLHDMKPAKDGGVSKLESINSQLLEALKDARFKLYGGGAGNPKIDAAIAAAEADS